MLLPTRLPVRVPPLPHPLSARRRPPAASGDGGQSTVEYALVLLGVAAVALLVVAWAARTQAVGRLLDAVFEQLLRRVR